MHCENASAAAWAAACCAGSGAPPRGSSDWQACCAAWNWGELGSRPLGPLFEPPWIAMAPPEPGSGKFVIPCWRMHCEKASALSPFDPGDADDDDDGVALG